MKAQVSVEFLFGLALVLAMMAALIIPGMRESELASATQATRLALINFTAYNHSTYATTIELTKQGDNRVDVSVKMIDRATHANTATPATLKAEIAYSIGTVINSANPISACALCPLNTVCTTSASFVYCVI